MKVLVTGGTGFLGSHLIDRLLEDPDTEVHALVRDPGRTRWLPAGNRLRILEGDLSHVPKLPDGLSVVFHLAGLTKATRSSDYYTVNEAGTASLFRALAAGAASPKVIHLSSLAAAGPSAPGRPAREADPPRPISPYGVSKLAAEREALAYKDRFPLVVLRVAASFGPRDEDFLDFFRFIRRGILPLYGRRPKTLSLCYAGDAVEAVLLAARAPLASGEVLNIAHPHPASWQELGETAGRLLGRKFVRVHIPAWGAFMVCAASSAAAGLLSRPAALNLSKYKDMQPDHWEADVSKARRALGFEARVSLEDGFRETLDWYVARGLL